MASRSPEEDESDEPELPLTQPLGSQDEELILPFQPKRHYWGYLEAQQDYYSNYELRNESWKCGRGFTLDCTLKGPQIPAEVLSTISRTHFVIELVVDEEDINGVYATLTDQSTGGTYVNGERVSKKSRPLIHGDMISITFPSNQAFRFYFMTPSQNPNTAEYINRKTLLFNLPSQVQEKYLVGKRLGAGSGGVVLQAFQRLPDGSVSNDKVAMKVIEKGVKGSKRFIKEGRILKELDHPCIIKVKEIFENSRFLVLMLEYAKGGELFEFVLQEFQKGEHFDEKVAKFQFYQLLSAIEYLHGKKVCHRDLKLDNILFSKKGKTSLLKISDFGLSTVINQGRMLSLVGTPNYMAPEVRSLMRGGGNERHEFYSDKADMWSLGCILFSLLCGSDAFRDEFGYEDRINFEDNSKWRSISETAKELVKLLIKDNPEERLSASEALSHKWFSEDAMIVDLAKQVMEGKCVSPEDLKQEERQSRKRPRFSQEIQETTAKLSRMMS